MSTNGTHESPSSVNLRSKALQTLSLADLPSSSTALDISSNALAALPTDLAQQLPHLTDVRAGWNHLGRGSDGGVDAVDPVCKCLELRVLHLPFNKLHRIGPRVGTLRRLRVLLLNDNEIEVRAGRLEERGSGGQARR